MLRFLFFSTLFLAIAIGIAIYTASRASPELNFPIKVHASNYHIDNLLGKYKDVIGSDYPGYRNHVMRLYTYTMHILEAEKVSKEYIDKHLHVLESGLVFHDIGLWTDKQLDYLEPSSARAVEHYKSLYNEEEVKLLHNIIYWHHKVTPYEGEHAALVNAVRRADWIDATMGLVNHGMPFGNINRATKEVPDAGFHVTLATIGNRYYGMDFPRIVRELSTILKW